MSNKPLYVHFDLQHGTYDFSEKGGLYESYSKSQIFERTANNMSTNDICLFEQKKISVDEFNLLWKESTAPIIKQKECIAILFRNDKGCYLCGIASTFEILECLQDYETNKISIKIAFNNAIIEIQRNFFTAKGLKSLADYGIDIDEKYANQLSKYYLSIINGMESHITNAPLGFVSDSNQILFYGYNLKSSPELKKKANKGYISKLNDLIAKAVGCQFGLVCGVSSMILAILSRKCNLPLSSFIIHVYGDSSTGKTTWLNLASSVYTKPDDPIIKGSWNATNNSILNSLDRRFGVIKAIDESSINQTDYSKLLYSISENTGRERLTSSCKAAKQSHFLTTVLSTGEESMLACETNKNRGLLVRVFEFCQVKITNSAEHAKAINAFVNKQYGYIGKHLSELLIQYEPSELTSLYEESKKDIADKIQDRNQLSERLIDTYAILVMSATLLKKLKFEIDINEIANLLINNYNEYIKSNDPIEDAYFLLLNYIVRNELIDNTKLFKLTEEKFHNILKENGYRDTKSLAKKMADRGFLVRKDNRVKQKFTINGIVCRGYVVVLDAVEADYTEPMQELKKRINSTEEFIYEDTDEDVHF